jgi:hypothetical protein
MSNFENIEQQLDQLNLEGNNEELANTLKEIINFMKLAKQGIDSEGRCIRCPINYPMHDPNIPFILYMETESMDARNKLNEIIDANEFDCTGGQTAYKDGSLQEFGNKIVKAAREKNVKLYRVLRMHDPGIGLSFCDHWITAGLEAGVFEKYDLPEDVITYRDSSYMGHM